MFVAGSRRRLPSVFSALMCALLLGSAIAATMAPACLVAGASVTQMAPSPRVSDKCIQAFEYPLNWITIIQSSGLNFNSMGDYYSCNAHPDFHFCVLDAGHHDVTEALCMPAACSAAELTNLTLTLVDANVTQFMINHVQREWDNLCDSISNATRVAECKQDFYEFTANLTRTFEVLASLEPQVQCGNHRQTKIDGGIVAMGIVIFLIISFAATQLYIDLRQANEFSQEERPILSLNDGGVPPPRRPRTMFGKLLKAFSVRDNMSNLLSSQPSRTLKCLDGLRGLSMFWIILGHTLNFQVPGFVGMRNPDEIQDSLQRPTAQFVVSGSFAVDTFFVLSGLLTAYVLMRKVVQGFRVPVVMGIILRYLRVTPLLAFVVGIYATLFKYLGQGPLWFRFLDELEWCKTAWWQNLLYINNFYPVVYDEQCIPWAWYLADDMQYSIIGLMILALYRFSRKGMYILMGALVICGLVSTGVIAHTHNVTLVQGNSQNLIYDKPYTRCAAYGFGLLAGCFISLQARTIKSLPQLTAQLLLVSSCAGLVGIMYATVGFNWESQDPNWNTTAMLAYNVLARPAWSFLLCVLIVACVTGHGSFVGWLLSLPLWEPLGRLTFGAYLIHPAIIRTVYYQRRQLFDFGPVEYSTYFVAFLAASYAVATVLFVLVEQPSAVLIGYLKKGKR